MTDQANEAERELVQTAMRLRFSLDQPEGVDEVQEALTAFVAIVDIYVACLLEGALMEVGNQLPNPADDLMWRLGGGWRNR